MTSPQGTGGKMYKRKFFRWLFPQVQGRVLLFLAMISVVSVMAHVAGLVWTLTSLAGDLPNDGRELQEAIPALLVRNTLLTLVFTLPAVMLMGAAAMMPVVGPFYRFRLFLMAVAKGEQRDDLRLRQGDGFQDVAQLLNDATAPARASSLAEREAMHEASLRSAA